MNLKESENLELLPWKNFSLKRMTTEIDGVFYTEKWIDISGYERFYKISSFGRIKAMKKEVIISYGTIRRHQTYIMKQRPSNHGHLRIQFPFKYYRRKKRYKAFLVHRLVAQEFIPNPLKKPCVNHKDCNPENNFINNLEWNTHSENTIHAYENGLFIPPKLPRMTRPVKCIKTGIIYESIRSACAATGVSESTIYHKLRKGDKNNSGFIYFTNKIQKK